MKRAPARNFQELVVWQKAHGLVMAIYRYTDSFPRSELYGLTSQLRRSAVSVPANIAEGRHRKSSKEFLQHISIAYGSLAELETHLLIAERLNYIEMNELDQALGNTAEIGKMLNGLRKSLNARI